MTDSTKKVMIIDDDQKLLKLLADRLPAAGYQIETADRGAAGLQKLLAGDFDLVVIDINMPEISGLAICSALRKHEKTSEIKVILTTSVMYTPPQTEQLKAEYGPDEFLLKPFTVPDLCKRLDSMLKPPPVEKPTMVRQLSDWGSMVPQLLHQLYSDKATGLLHLQNDKQKKIIYIKDGYPVFARSNVLNECLGRLLVKKGVITQVDCDASVERSKESGRLQGTVLIEMGLLTPQGLHEALAHQVTEKLLSTFKWESGTGRFVPGKDFKKNITTIKLSPASLIMQGVKLYWTKKRLESFLEPCRELYLKQGSNPKYRFQDVELSRRGEEIFADCRGNMTLAEILQQHPLARLEAQQVLAGLLISEMIEASAIAEYVEVEEPADKKHGDEIDEGVRHKVLNDYKTIMDADYFEVLGVERDCSNADVRRAYYRLAKEYHPDRYLGSGLSREMSVKIHEMFQYVSQAYSVLSDAKTRADYLDELINGPKKSIDVNQIIEAESAFQEGRAMLNVRRYKDAVKPLRRAIELSPEEPEYLTSYAWALFKSSPEQRETQHKAQEILIASRELNPEHDLTHLYLGYVYQALDKERLSEKSFEMAVQANPGCNEALRELRLINLRREQQSQSKGLLKKFIHKND